MWPIKVIFYSRTLKRIFTHDFGNWSRLLHQLSHLCFSHVAFLCPVSSLTLLYIFVFPAPRIMTDTQQAISRFVYAHIHVH